MIMLKTITSISRERIIRLNSEIEEGWNDTVIHEGHSAMEKLIKKYE